MKSINDYIGKVVQVIVDRPLGSKHPRYDWNYPINYGYIPNTISGDGKELDVYLLGVTEPVKKFEGECITVIKRKDDNDPKLIVVPQGIKMTDNEITKSVEFQEKWFDSYIER